ncbi:hypothetical protein GGR54DRAFT_379254 [Hypoxylon sp. NC1633]|nr:hypothetical protein GGR54DRAFT_379254 [Hypoxylon sp. NC1633]
MALCYGAVGTSGRRYTALGHPSICVKYIRRDIYAGWGDIFHAFGESVKFSRLFSRPATSSDRRLPSEEVKSHSGVWLRKGCSTHPVIRDGGLGALEYIVPKELMMCGIKIGVNWLSSCLLHDPPQMISDNG